MSTIIRLNDDISRTKEYVYKKCEYNNESPTKTNEVMKFITDTLSQIFDIQDCKISFQLKEYPGTFKKDLEIEVNRCLTNNGYYGNNLGKAEISLMDDSKYYKDVLKPEDNKPSLLLMLKNKEQHLMDIFKIVAAALNYLYYCDTYGNMSHEIMYETTEENIPLDEEHMDAKIESVLSTLGTNDLYTWHLEHFPNASIQMILDIYYVLIRDAGMVGYDYLRHYDYFTAQLSCNLYEYLYLMRSIDNTTPVYITKDIIDTFTFYKDIFGRFKTISVFNLLTQVIYPYVIGLRACIINREDNLLFVSPYDHVISTSKYVTFSICSVISQLFTNRASNILRQKCDYFDYMKAWNGCQAGKYFIEISVIAKLIKVLLNQKTNLKAHLISPFIEHPIIFIFIIHYLKEKIPNDYPLFTSAKLSAMMDACKPLALLQMITNIDEYCNTEGISFEQTNETLDEYLCQKTKGKIKSFTASKYQNSHLKNITNQIIHSNGKYEAIKKIITFSWKK